MARSTPIWAGLSIEEADAGWISEQPLVKSSDVLDALARRHSEDGWNRPARWVFLREVYAQTGLYADSQRFDAVAIGLVPSNDFLRVVYEVKVSRSDWLRELKPITDYHYDLGDGRMHRINSGTGKWHDDQGDTADIGIRATRRNKWDAAMAVAHEFWYAAPPKCIAPSELPNGAGLVEVRAWGKDRELRPRVVVPAERREVPEPGPEFWASVLRSLADRRRTAA